MMVFDKKPLKSSPNFKSFFMGAMVKSGTRPIRGVLKIAQAPKKPGLYLLDTTPDEKLEPAHHEAADPSDMLDLIACGAHIVFLVTGRGHVVGTPVSPVIKVTGNPRTYGRMKDDIDFCAAPALTGNRSLEDLSDDLLKLVSRVGQGERPKAERLDHREELLYFNYQDPEKVPCEWHFKAEAGTIFKVFFGFPVFSRSTAPRIIPGLVQKPGRKPGIFIRSLPV